jgi:hypothetical protein
MSAVQYRSNLDGVLAALQREAEVRAYAAGNEVRNAWLEVLSGTRSGRTYRIPGTKRTYTASAPGEAPAVRFGDLRRSVKVERDPTDPTRVIVGSDLKKAVQLEKGTRRMAPRPHLQPAVEKAMPEVERAFNVRWLDG